MTPLQAAIDLTISVQMVANRQILQDFHGISEYRIYIENPYDVVRLWVNSRKEAEE